MKVGDKVKKKCVRPEYGTIIGKKLIKTDSVTTRWLTVQWDDGTIEPAWPADIEVTNRGLNIYDELEIALI